MANVDLQGEVCGVGIVILPSVGGSCEQSPLRYNPKGGGPKQRLKESK